MTDIRIAGIFSDLNLDSSKFEKGLKRADSQLGAFQRKMGQFGRKFTTAFTVPFGALGGAALKLGIDLDRSMANIGTLLGEVSDTSNARLGEMKTGIRDLATETGLATGDLADGLYQVVSAFGDSAESVDQLTIAAKAGVAGVARTSDAINLISAVTKNYGDTSAEAQQKVSDLAFQTVKLGQTTFPELARAMGLVAPLSKTLGVSMEELFGVMATGTGVTGTASEVSTQLRGILSALLKPTKDLAALYESLGVESGKALIEQQGLQGALLTITKAAKAADLPITSFIGQVEGASLAMALTGAQADTFAGKLKSMHEAMGATQAAYDQQTKGINELGHEFKKAKQVVVTSLQIISDNIKIVFGGESISFLKGFSETLKTLVKRFVFLEPSTKKWVVGLAGVLAAIGPIGLGLRAIIGTLRGFVPLIKGITTVTKGLGLFAKPMLSTLTMGIKLFVDPLKTALLPVLKTVEKAFVAAFTSPLTIIPAIGVAVAGLAVVFADELIAPLNKMGKQINDFFRDIVRGAKFVQNVLSGHGIRASMEKATVETAQFMRDAFTTNFFEGFGDDFKKGADTIKTKMSELVNDLGEILAGEKGIGKVAKEAITDKLSESIDAVYEQAEKMIPKTEDLDRKIAEYGKSTIAAANKTKKLKKEVKETALSLNSLYTAFEKGGVSGVIDAMLGASHSNLGSFLSSAMATLGNFGIDEERLSEANSIIQGFTTGGPIGAAIAAAVEWGKNIGNFVSSIDDVLDHSYGTIVDGALQLQKSAKDAGASFVSEAIKTIPVLGSFYNEIYKGYRKLWGTITFGLSDKIFGGLEKSIGKLFGMSSDLGTRERKAFGKWISDAIKEGTADAGVVIEVAGEDKNILDNLYMNKYTGEMEKFNTATAEGLTKFEGFLGIAKGFDAIFGGLSIGAGQLANILAGAVGGSLNNLQMVLKGMNFDVQQFSEQLQAGWLQGEISAREFISVLDNARNIMAQGIPDGVGMIGMAFDNLEKAGDSGGQMFDALGDIGQEAIEKFGEGAPIEKLREHLLGLGYPLEQVGIFMQGLSDRGIGSLEALRDITEEEAARMQIALEDMGFQFSEVTEDIDSTKEAVKDLGDTIAEIPTEKELTIKINSDLDPDMKKLLDAGVLDKEDNTGNTGQLIDKEVKTTGGVQRSLGRTNATDYTAGRRSQAAIINVDARGADEGIEERIMTIMSNFRNEIIEGTLDVLSYREARGY